MVGDMKGFQPKKQPCLVVLAGWLGCRPRHLRRYVELYEGLGCETFTIIAPPAAIVDYCSLSPQDLERKLLLQSIKKARRKGCKQEEMCGGEEECFKWPAEHDNDSLMKDVAMKVISHIERHCHCEDACAGESEPEPPCYMVHLFSNGGVFLWDQIQHLASTTEKNDTILRRCLSGIVFDSSPCYFDKHTFGIRQVMRTACSKDEWNAYEQRESQTLKLEGDALRQGFDLRQWRIEVEHQRALCLWQRSRNSLASLAASTGTAAVPTLFLYSRDDKATPYQPLRELVAEHKRQGQGEHNSQVVSEITFEKSAHCQHLLRHPKIYIQGVSNFVHHQALAINTTLPIQQSRL
jgi:hypothetical protein